MRKVLAPMLAQDAEQVEGESREGAGDLKVDETEPATHTALEQEPVEEREGDRRNQAVDCRAAGVGNGDAVSLRSYTANFHRVDHAILAVIHWATRSKIGDCSLAPTERTYRHPPTRRDR